MPVAVEQELGIDGEATEDPPTLLFRVTLENDHELLAHLAGKMRRFRIRVNPGDKVRGEVSPYDLNRGRIVYRSREAAAVPPARSQSRAWPTARAIARASAATASNRVSR